MAADQRPCTCDPTGLGRCLRHGDGAGVPDHGRPLPLPPPPRALRAVCAGTLAALLLLAAGIACGPDSGARPSPSPQPAPKAGAEGDAGGAHGGWAK